MENIMTNVVAAVGALQPRKRARSIIAIDDFENDLLIINGKRFFKSFAEGDLKNFNKRFVAILEKLRKDVQKGGLELSAEKRDTYLENLHEIGLAAYNKIFDEQAQARIDKLEEEARGRGLRMTLRTPTQKAFCWEMLYAGEPFELAPERFWGFRYPIGRAYWDIEAPDRIRLQAGLFSAIHGMLDRSRQEVQQLAQQVGEACKRWGLNLNLKLLDQEIPAEQLSKERLINFFHSEEFRYGIIHFACHCDNPKSVGATEAYLSFTSSGTELTLYLETLLAARKYGFIHQPFVFLNACGSATPGHLLQTVSFPSEILAFGAGGVIATACTLPDSFASAFGAEFYRRLLRLAEQNSTPATNSQSDFISQPADIGEALLQTRLHFLHQYNNPLGLAYGLYAVSNQELELAD
jgi:hypothetical protein